MMKILPIFLSLFLVSVALAEEPEALTDRRQAWETQRVEAQKKINKMYFDELEQLKRTFLKAGNLEGAVAVQNELDQKPKIAEPPAEFSKLRKSYVKSLKASRKRVFVSYYNDLEKLKQQFMNEANLAHSILADQEMKRVIAEYKKNPKPTAPRNRDATKVGGVGQKQNTNKGEGIQPTELVKSSAFQLDGVWERRNLMNGGVSWLTFKDKKVIVNNDPLIISREGSFFRCRSATSGWWFTCKPDPNNLDIMTGTRRNGDKLTFTRIK